MRRLSSGRATVSESFAGTWEPQLLGGIAPGNELPAGSFTSATLLVSSVQFPARTRGVTVSCRKHSARHQDHLTMRYSVSMLDLKSNNLVRILLCITFFFLDLCASLPVTRETEVRFPASQTSEVRKAVGPGDTESRRERRATEVPRS